KRGVAAALALIALALAIGATTGVFSVCNALLLRGLPFRNPERLIELSFYSPGLGADARSPSPFLETAAKFNVTEMTFNQEARQAQRVLVAETDSNFFQTLGTDPYIGRNFAADEDRKGQDGVAVIGYGIWQQAFGGDPRALGATIRLNGVPQTVVGIAPPGFDYPARSAVWAPTAEDMARLPKRGAFFFQLVGRLKPGLSFTAARAIFNAQVQRAFPEERIQKGLAVPVMRLLRDLLAGPVRDASLVLLAAVSLVLLIACANVAQVLLFAASERRRELSIRAALGASRRRLTRQLIIEAVALTLPASLAGLLVAEAIARLAATLAPAALTAQEYTIVDWRVLAFAIGLAAVTGLIFGVLPGLTSADWEHWQESIRSASQVRGTRIRRTRAALIVLQGALTVVLLAGSLTLARTFLKLLHTDLGYKTDHVVTMNVSLVGVRAEKTQPQYYREALDRLRRVPGVESAAAANYLPLMNYSIVVGASLKLTSGAEVQGAGVAVTPDFFRTLDINMIAGRDFAAFDQAGSEPVAIVNESFARASGYGLDILNKTASARYPDRNIRIVGVARDVHDGGPESSSGAMIYFPIPQSPPGFVTFVVRVRGKTELYLAVCRDVVQQIDRQIPVYDVKTLDQRLADALARPRLYTAAVSAFGGFALLLAVIGVYGSAAYSIAQRTHEIGVRSAIGASAGTLRRMLLGESLGPIGLGLAFGIGAAVAGEKLLTYLIVSAEPLSTGICAAAATLLAAAAFGAIWRASGRILRIDPMAALRAD
ncbi:MAG: ABC transporter permease, partial [Bryobacterales bacterium]|nr:ABC transporter permease [Bryobacterales bacterium]